MKTSCKAVHNLFFDNLTEAPFATNARAQLLCRIQTNIRKCQKLPCLSPIPGQENFPLLECFLHIYSIEYVVRYFF